MPRYCPLHLSPLDGCRTFVWQIPQRTHQFACVSQENQDRQKIRLKTAATVDQTKEFFWNICTSSGSSVAVEELLKSSERATAKTAIGTFLFPLLKTSQQVMKVVISKDLSDSELRNPELLRTVCGYFWLALMALMKAVMGSTSWAQVLALESAPGGSFCKRDGKDKDES